MVLELYNWEEIKEVLIKELAKTKHIMTFGTIGSLNVEHDIDTIITKKTGSKSSAFYKEVHNLFDNLNNYLMEKYNAKAICFSFNETESLKLSNYEDSKDLAIHLMVYTSYPQIEKDWGWALFKDEDIKETLKDYDCLIGSVDDLFSKDFMNANYYDSVFIYLSYYNRINANYSEEFLLEVMNANCDFLFRKRLGVKALVAKNKKEVRKYFYKLCDLVDRLEKEKEC